jgi:Amt family ammonium transporter
MPALAMGVAAAVACYFACTSLKGTFGYDDTLDAFGIHGVGGTVGALLTGVFATRAVQNLNNGEPLGLIEGGTLLKGQLIATGVTWLFAMVATFILLKILDATMGLRVPTQTELQGLDLNEHGEEGYIFM